MATCENVCSRAPDELVVEGGSVPEINIFTTFSLCDMDNYQVSPRRDAAITIKALQKHCIFIWSSPGNFLALYLKNIYILINVFVMWGGSIFVRAKLVKEMLELL